MRGGRRRSGAFWSKIFRKHIEGVGSGVFRRVVEL
jgi:hypothetical protein